MFVIAGLNLFPTQKVIGYIFSESQLFLVEVEFC